MVRMFKVVFVLGVHLEHEHALAESDHGGPLLSKWRLKAVKEILGKNIAEKAVIVGYKQLVGDKEIPRAEVMRNVLVDEYGVDPERIEWRLQKEPATKGNIKEILEYIVKEGLNESDVVVLTNLFHIPRSMMDFARSGLCIIPIAAESFFIESETESILLDYGVTSSPFATRFINELKGMRDKILGVY